VENIGISADLIRGKIDALILRCLVDGELYGVEITRKVTEASGGTYELKKPTLYSALRRLEGKKVIAGNDQIVDGVRRRYYKLTPKGEGYFDTKKGDWRQSTDVIANMLYGSAFELPTGKKAQDEISQETVLGAELVKKFFTEKKEVPQVATQMAFEVPLGGAKASSPTPLKPYEFNKYVGPEERPTVLTLPKQSVEPLPSTALERLDALIPNPNAKQSTKSSGSEVFFLEKNDAWRTHSRDRFLLINRLRFATSLLSAVLVVIGIAIAGAVLQDQVGGYLAFTLGFVAACVYLAINLAVFAVFPNLRRRRGNYRLELVIRFIISAALVAILVGANLVAGVTHSHLSEYFAFFLVPAILSLVVFLDGLGYLLFKRFAFFKV